MPDGSSHPWEFWVETKVPILVADISNPGNRIMLPPDKHRMRRKEDVGGYPWLVKRLPEGEFGELKVVWDTADPRHVTVTPISH